jgi:excisionase family DNA binding protein
MGEGHPETGTPSGIPSGTDRASDRSEVYTVQEAAKVLGITERRVRALAQEGRIEGERTEGGWKLFRYSVHSFRDERRDRERPSEARGSDSSLSVSEWLSRVEALQRELGRLEGRLELTERAESSLREDLERERSERLEAQERAERLEQERRRLESEHRRAEEEAQSLREELETERGKGFWRKLFGGSSSRPQRGF